MGTDEIIKGFESANNEIAFCILYLLTLSKEKQDIIADLIQGKNADEIKNIIYELENIKGGKIWQI